MEGETSRSFLPSCSTFSEEPEGFVLINCHGLGFSLQLGHLLLKRCLTEQFGKPIENEAHRRIGGMLTAVVTVGRGVPVLVVAVTPATFASKVSTPASTVMCDVDIETSAVHASHQRSTARRGRGWSSAPAADQLAVATSLMHWRVSSS